MLGREAAAKYIHELLQLMVDSRGSDLFITTEFSPAIKVDSKVTPISQQPLNVQQAPGLIRPTMNEEQLCKYEDSSGCSLAITASGAECFHVSTFIQ